MKRYRLVNVDFDTRATVLETVVEQGWEPRVRAQWQRNQRNVRRELGFEFGDRDLDRKIVDFIDLGPAPFSILAWHNKFYRHIRVSFTAGSYYPALVASGALGERILNHLVRTLRDDFRRTPQYKSVYRKQSFEDWGKAITVLEAWGVLQPEAAKALRELERHRHDAVHFRPELDADARAPALAAIRTLGAVIEHQFGAFGTHPWLFNTPGETYIKKESESDPFVAAVYLPNCDLVGPKHTLEFDGAGFRVVDNEPYEDVEIDDAEFARLRSSATGAS